MSNGDASLDEEDLASFRNQVVEYLQLPERIKTAEEPVKQMKARKKQLEANIQEFMKQQDIAQCNIPEDVGGGVLVLKTATRKSALKKDNWKLGIENAMRKRGIDQLTAEQVIEEVNATRELVTSHDLKRIKR